MQIQIREACAADAQDVCGLLRRSIALGCGEDHRNDPAILDAWLGNKTPENVMSWFSCGANLSLVAEADGRVAGIAVLTRAGKIALFYVCPDLRFRGIGKRLLQEVEQRAAGLGLESLQVPSTYTARRFYESSGYLSRSTSMSPYGVEVINMAKVLPANPHKRCRCGG